jgi:ABC-2 type transport system ATP-binding protein
VGIARLVTDNAIHVRALRKRFGAVEAVRGIDLVVPRGSLFGLIGQNGAGKTTLIKMMLGVVRPTSGDIAVLGGSPDDVAVRRKVGYLPERLDFPPGFTPLLLINSTQRFKGVPSSKRLDEAHRLLEWVGLDKAAWTRAIGGFSKGMKQRTGLALALVGSPELIVLDEPTDGIDPLGRAQLRDRIAAVRASGTTVFLNSHLLAETERMCDHVAILHRGQVVQSGSLSSLRRTDAWHVRFSPHASLTTLAAAAGFVDIEPDTGTARCLGHDERMLSAALQRALIAGLCVVEVRADTVDLETLLAQAMQGDVKAEAA